MRLYGGARRTALADRRGEAEESTAPPVIGVGRRWDTACCDPAIAAGTVCALVDILIPKPYPPTLRYSLLRSCYRRRHCVCVLVDILTQNHILRRWDTACCDPRPCRVWSRVDGAEAEPA